MATEDLEKAIDLGLNILLDISSQQKQS